MRQFWFSCFLSLLTLLGACGRDDDAVQLPEGDPEASLKLASPADIDAGRVVPHSYLVAFRNLLENGPSSFPAFHMAAFAHLKALRQRWARSAPVETLSYLSRINLNQLSQSFYTRSALSPAPWMTYEPAREAAWASLIEVRFPSEAAAEATLRRWYAEKRIWYAEPNFTQEVSGTLEDQLSQAFGGSNAGVAPWLDQIDFVPAIQEIGKLATPNAPLIAVMDSGVDVEHPSLRDSIYINSRAENKLLCRNDRYGCNTTAAEKEVLGNGDVFPTGTSGFGQACPFSLGFAQGQCEHGTHVAGLIVARNASRVSGVCPYCKILVVKVVENKGGRLAISDAAIIAGLSYISGLQEGGQPLVRIINASYGKFEYTRSVELFVKALKNFGRGILMVAAAGNEDSTKKQYPAAFEEVVAVANVLAEGDQPAKSESSNFGMWVDIAAPGDWFACTSDVVSSSGLLSTVPGGEFGCKVGTSMATPIVSGVAGLVLAKEPNLTAGELEERLKRTAVAQVLYQERLNQSYRPTINGQSVPLLGGGLVNALRAVRPDLSSGPTLGAEQPDRIKPGCGVIGYAGEAARERSSWMGLLLLMLPLPMILIMRRAFSK